MSARAWPTRLLVYFGVPFALLMIGLGAVAAMLVDERGEALADLDARATLQRDAFSTALRAELAQRLAHIEDELDQAIADPLRGGDDLVLLEHENQRLPLGEGFDSEAAAWLDNPKRAADELAMARAYIMLSLPETYDAWMAQRRHYQLAPDVDLATTLLALEHLEKAGALTPDAAKAQLRDGVKHPEADLPGWFPTLLRSRPRLTPEDFERLLARGVALAKRHLVRVDDVLARAEATPPVLPEALFALTDEPGALIDGWVVRAKNGRVVGYQVDLPARIEALRRAQFPTVRAAIPRLEARTPLASLTVDTDAATWQGARDRVAERFVWKLAPLAACALLAIAVGALALTLQRRRADYLELRGKLLSAVTHELKTPLASIRALAETLELRLPDHPDARDYPQRIVASTERLGFLVDNVLSFGRLERGAWRPRHGPLPVSELAAWLAADPITRARPVDFTADVPDGLAIHADPDLVRLALSNLVDNAARHATAARVAVRLGARAIGGKVELSVSDDGPGLPDPARAFDPTRLAERAGLGLAIVAMVMSLHRGAVRAERPGRGTTVVLTFPS